MALAGGMAAQTTQPGRTVPPVWTPIYNAEQGPLPDTSDWPVIIRGKHVVVRLAPGSDWSHYGEVAVGDVRYTGSEIKLKPREIAQVTDMLETRMAKDLRRVKLSAAPGASGKLKVDANITDAKTTNRLLNATSEFSSVALGFAADVGRANVTAWVRDGETKEPVASIEMSGSGTRYERGYDLFRTGQIRLLLREESRTLAEMLSQMGPAIGALKAKGRIQ
jgi:hypothetical protein